MVSELCTYPFKIMESRYLKLYKLGTATYEDFFRFITKNFEERGAKGIFNGFTMSLLYQMIYRALIFGIYDSLRLLLLPEKSYDFLICYPSGYLAAFISNALCFPMHRIALEMSEANVKGF
jgi:hypothetical protein